MRNHTLQTAFQYSDTSHITLSLLRTRHSYHSKNASEVRIEDMEPAYWNARFFPDDCKLRLDDNCGNTTLVPFKKTSTIRDLVRELRAFYHAPANPDLVEIVKRNEFFGPEDENDVRVCDLMQGLVTSYGLQRVSSGLYELDLHMF